MLSKVNSAVVAQCWYLRRHVPEGRRRRDTVGVVHCTCRYCERPIRSLDGGRWDLAEGFDLDALAGSSPTSHFCVVDRLDEMVIGRYPVAVGATEEEIAARRLEICEKHGIEEGDDVLEIRLVQTDGGSFRIH